MKHLFNKTLITIGITVMTNNLFAQNEVAVFLKAGKILLSKQMCLRTIQDLRD